MRGRKKKTTSRPFQYEPAKRRSDVFALNPLEIVDSTRFLVGWIQDQAKNRLKPAMPLYASFADIGRVLVGIELRRDARWYLPTRWTRRLNSAGIEKTPGGGPWKIVDYRRFNLAIYQILTSGRYYMSTQKRWLALGAEAPVFDLLYPRAPRAKPVIDEVLERSREHLSQHFGEEIKAKLFE